MTKSIIIVLLAEIVLIALYYVGFKVYKDEPIFPKKEAVEVISADTLNLEAPAKLVETGVSTEEPVKAGVSTPLDTLKVTK